MTDEFSGGGLARGGAPEPRSSASTGAQFVAIVAVVAVLAAALMVGNAVDELGDYGDAVSAAKLLAWAQAFVVPLLLGVIAVGVAMVAVRLEQVIDELRRRP